MNVLGLWYLGGQQLLLGVDLLLLSGCQILQLVQRHVQTRSRELQHTQSQSESSPSGAKTEVHVVRAQVSHPVLQTSVHRSLQLVPLYRLICCSGSICTQSTDTTDAVECGAEAAFLFTNCSDFKSFPDSRAANTLTRTVYQLRKTSEGI